MPTMHNIDAQLGTLWEQARAGSESAYRAFLTALATPLRSYVRRQLLRYGRSESETEDIVQEALLAIHEKRHTHDQDIPITAWAYAITRYKLIDFLRLSEKDARALPLEDIEQTVGSDSMQLDVRLSVRKILAALPEGMRHPIELMKLMGHSAKEAATLTGQSEAAVKVNVHRGLKAMARSFG